MKIFATATGNNQKQPLLFIHDFMSSSDEWTPIIKLLQEDFYCISIDLPGHGKSQYTSFDTWDDVVIEFGKVLTLIKRPIMLVGRGLGGRIALGMCEKYNEQIIKLILIETIPGIPDALDKQKHYIDDLRIFNELGNKLTSEQAGWKNAIKFLSIGRMPSYGKIVSTYGSKIIYFLNNSDNTQMKLADEYQSKCEIEFFNGETSELFTKLMNKITSLK